MRDIELKMKRATKRVWAAAICCAFVFAGICSGQTPARNGEPAEKLSLDGVENFARVDGRLYRGAQPRDLAINELKNAGISIVVDFREEKVFVNREKREVEDAGMRFVSMPWDAHHGPKHEQIVTFLNLLRQNQDKKIFVHCERGADRTGLMMAVYRITFDHWTAEQAVKEMKAFHYDSRMLANLERYVRAYPAKLAADPELRGETGGRATQ